ncbi:hypothetical protein Lal_00044787 [Lupinus albus]|uniref:Uncharacterized protein n=1 Tax=Lupinus albus TaxID=3870 RepID=A0A6A4N1A2_LUPAL|nr:hypothetical protein Lalb_Chr24g0402161 [Lupinus albus]KAF1858754.1 hypothetical protein Lal_00044787 [Lupinus albus]
MHEERRTEATEASLLASPSPCLEVILFDVVFPVKPIHCHEYDTTMVVDAGRCHSDVGCRSGFWKDLYESEKR